MRLKKTLLCFFILVLLAGISLTSTLAAGGLFETYNAPDLTIPQLGPVLPETTVSIPVQFHSGGIGISSIFFSIDYDETHLAFNPADGNGDGIPDSMKFNLPYAFITEVTYKPDNLNGELKILIYQFSTPFTPVPEGSLLTIDFTTLNAGDPWTVSAAVNFAESPAVSFGGINGGDVTGTTQDGSILIAPPGTVIDTPTATATHTATPTFTPTPTATATATATAIQPVNNTPVPSLTPTPTDIVSSPHQSSKIVYLPFSLINSPLTYTISGRVLDIYNRAVPGVTISAGDGWTAVTDYRGKYTLQNLPPGTYVIRAYKNFYRISPANRQVTVPPSASGINFTAR